MDGADPTKTEVTEEGLPNTMIGLTSIQLWSLYYKPEGY